MSSAVKPVKRLAIVGLGLMGGALGMAVRARGLAESVRAFARREETRRAALDMKAADEVFATPEEAVKGSDFVVFCVPVLAIPDLAKACRPHFARGAVITDVGSTKAELASRLEPVFDGIHAGFVGSHPMAGSEKTGIAAARADLYDGALAVVTPSPGAAETAVARVAAFWERLGCRVVRMAPVEHDRIIARTSHLPHLVAAMLVKTVLSGDERGVAEFCGSGFRDTTRVAGGSEDMWHDIVKTNRRFVMRELDAFAGTLERVRGMVKDGDFERLRTFLAESRAKRRRYAQRDGTRGEPA
jgi:prephenate dehydrogenase